MHGFRGVSDESIETQRKLNVSQKIPHQEVRCNFGILRNKHCCSQICSIKSFLKISRIVLKTHSRFYSFFFFWLAAFNSTLRILTEKKHPKIKLQRLRKIRILTFGSLVHQINSFKEILKLEQIFQKN